MSSLETPSVRIAPNPLLRRMIEGEKRKIEAQDTLQQVLLAIQYMKDLDMDGNILYFIESAKELLPGYIKTSKGLILPREIVRKRGNIQGKRTDNDIRIPETRLTNRQLNLELVSKLFKLLLSMVYYGVS
jgi:hypothetical protein